MAEIKNVLSRLVKIFHAINLKYVIVGGIAVIHYGHVRATQDIDIIISMDDENIVVVISGIVGSPEPGT